MIPNELEIEELYLKWPNRRREIHDNYCEKCPSHWSVLNGHSDPETEKMKELSKEAKIQEGLFLCAWRPNKLCKGICEALEITKEDLELSTNHAHGEHNL